MNESQHKTIATLYALAYIVCRCSLVSLEEYTNTICLSLNNYTLCIWLEYNARGLKIGIGRIKG